MKPFSDEDLIAYHLHELSPRRARALERALRSDPSLAAESEIYAATLRVFKEDTPLVIDEETFDRNWTALRSSLRVHPSRSRVSSRWHIPALVGGGLAFAATLIVATHHRFTAIAPQTHNSNKPAAISQPVPSTKNSLAAVVPLTSQSDGAEDYGRVPKAYPLGSPRSPMSSAHRRISYLSLAPEPATVPHFIPLASTPQPLLLGMPSFPGSIEPGPPGLIVLPSGSSGSRRRHISAHREHPVDLTLSMGGTLIGTRDASGSGDVVYSQGATHAVSALAALHQQLRPLVGYRVTFSYTRPDFYFSRQTAGNLLSTANLNGRIYELAATYVVQGPHHGALSTSAEAGAGLMGIIPTLASTDTSSNLRGAAVVGVAAEIALTKHLAIHAAYRGQAFKGPDFNYTGYAAPFVTATLFSNEPTMGITYRFSHK